MKKPNKFSYVLVQANKILMCYVHSIIEDLTDEETTPQEKNELLVSTASSLTMMATSGLTLLTTLVTAFTLIFNPIQNLNQAQRVTRAEIAELQKLKQELKDNCDLSDSTSLAPPPVSKSE